MMTAIKRELYVQLHCMGKEQRLQTNNRKKQDDDDTERRRGER
jgi:hypothetical protein